VPNSVPHPNPVAALLRVPQRKLRGCKVQVACALGSVTVLPRRSEKKEYVAESNLITFCLIEKIINQTITKRY